LRRFDLAARWRAFFRLRFRIAFFAADLLLLGIGASFRDAPAWEEPQRGHRLMLRAGERRRGPVTTAGPED